MLGLLLLCYSYGGSDILDMAKHEDGVLVSVFQLLEQQQGLFVITEATLYNERV